MIGIPVENMRHGTIRKPPPMPKKPDSAPVPRPVSTSLGQFLPSRRTSASPGAGPRGKPPPRPRQHQEREQRRDLPPVAAFPQAQPREGPRHAGEREDAG